MKHYLFGPDALKKMREGGLIPEGIQRVVIDIPHDDYATMYIQKALDEDIIDILISEHGNDNRLGLQVKRSGGIVGGRVDVVVGEHGPEQYKRFGS